MVRTIETSVTVYQLDELTEEAQQKAIDDIRDKLAGRWWDEYDNEAISEVIVATLGASLGTPGWEKYGVSDFPGIPNVSVTSWNLDSREVAVSGTLYRDNAPGLPWVDGIDSLSLDGRRDTRIDIVDGEPECTCPPESPWNESHTPECASLTPPPATDAQRAALEDAVRDAIHEALKAGQAEYDYKTSEEYAKDQIKANGYEFTEAGEFYA